MAATRYTRRRIRMTISRCPDSGPGNDRSAKPVRHASRVLALPLRRHRKNIQADPDLHLGVPGEEPRQGDARGGRPSVAASARGRPGGCSRVRPRHPGPARRMFELHGSRVALTNVRPDAERADTSGWWRADAWNAAEWNKIGPRGSMRDSTRMKNVGLLLGLFGRHRNYPRWTLRLAKRVLAVACAWTRRVDPGSNAGGQRSLRGSRAPACRRPSD